MLANTRKLTIFFFQSFLVFNSQVKALIMYWVNNLSKEKIKDNQNKRNIKRNIHLLS